MAEKIFLWLNSLSQARTARRNGQIVGRTVLAATPSLQCWCGLHGIESVQPSELFTPGEALEVKARASDLAGQALARLDEAVAGEVKAHAGLGLGLFTSLYDYLGRHHLAVLLFHVLTARRVFSRLGASRLEIFDYAVNINLFGGGPLSELLAEACPEIETTVVGSEPLLEVPIPPRIEGNSLPDLQKGTCLLVDESYGLKSLSAEIRQRMAVVSLKEFLGTPAPPDAALPTALVEEAIREQEEPVARVFMRDLARDLAPDYARNLAIIRRTAERAPRLSVAIWAAPPVWGTSAVVVPSLLALGVPVGGIQHGCLYGETTQDWHLYSDYRYCTTFFSYGFTAEELHRIIPEVPCDVLPMGKYPPPPIAASQREVDVVFPVTNSLSVDWSGMTRTPPHTQLAWQLDILDHLAKIEGLRVDIKPFPGATQENCAPLLLRERWPELNFVLDTFYEDYLSAVRPRIIVFEFPSQPLVQSLHLDAEIFMTKNTLVPHTSRPMELLDKRVHMAEDAAELLRDLDSFLKGEKPPKRDNAYIDQYLYRPGRTNTFFEGVAALAGTRNFAEGGKRHE